MKSKILFILLIPSKFHRIKIIFFTADYADDADDSAADYSRDENFQSSRIPKLV